MKFKLHNSQMHALRSAEAISSAAWAEKLWDSGDMVEGYLKDAREYLTTALSELDAYAAERSPTAAAKIIEFPPTAEDQKIGDGTSRL